MLSSFGLSIELRRAFQDAKEYARSRGYSGAMNFIVNYLSFNKPDELYFQISNSEYGAKKVEVEAKVLSDALEEFLRRFNFTLAQTNLQIGPPIVEQDAQPNDDELIKNLNQDEEIPF